ncbi:hypothetical protein KSP40_PGU007315 [Platanthera guangdongensis]|uniref:Uncharacterized protein n=1 Tax=Platanthera guangdongensis TaxID=2320717 RepID=A0ABR2LJ83_9ASPA
MCIAFMRANYFPCAFAFPPPLLCSHVSSFPPFPSVQTPTIPPPLNGPMTMTAPSPIR